MGWCGLVAVLLVSVAPLSFASPAYSTPSPLPYTSTFSSAPSSTCAAPKTKYHSFTYTQLTSDRYATPLPSPVNFGTTFAPPYTIASRYLPKNVTTTTYVLNRDATTINDGPYGQSAFAALWEGTTFSSTLPFTTTVSPTPVVSSELVYPPALYTPCPSADACLDCYEFPSDFIWGVSSSAYQIEGGLQWEGRGPSTLDGDGNYAGGSDGNIDNMNYFYYKQDIVRLAAIGVPHLAFSIPWTRIVPFGFANTPINQEALAHYEDLINTCLENGIKPIITLCHYDRPAGLSADEDAFVPAFLYYAKQVMTHFGDRVPIWLTFNEPNLDPSAYFTSNVKGPTNVLLAHAQVYKWYKNTLKGTAQISMKFANNLGIPQNYSSSEDHSAAERYQDFILGIYGNPLFLGKQYPDSVLNTPGYNLTALTKEQIRYIHGTMDFWSFDPYSAQYVAAPPGGVAACANEPSNPNYPYCAVGTNVQLNGWLMGNEGWYYQFIAPQYVRQQMSWVWNTFRPSGILVAEFGFQIWGEYQRTLDEQRYDLDRSLYYQYFLRELLKSIYEDDVNVIGTLAWTYADDNEFGDLTQHFGMQTVNRTGSFDRRYKRSFFDYVDFFYKYAPASK